MTAGSVLGIARRHVKRGPMLTLQQVEISTAAGVKGDTRGRPGPRQVTVLAASAWVEACADAATDLPWFARRANLLIEGLDLRFSTGAILHLGDGIQLLVTGELEPCQRMDEAAPGLCLALAQDWRGGVTCLVRRGGALAVGDSVRLQSPD